MNNTLNISPVPHVRDRGTTKFIMYTVILSLLPATVVGIAMNGLHAFYVVLCSVATAVLTEYIFDYFAGKPDTWLDGSAVVTGLMLALTLSPTIPLFIPILGSVFAILVVKCAFGGLGKNFVNPALAARCFLLISFGTLMTNYAVDGVSSATPVAMLLEGKAVNVTKMFLGVPNDVIGSSTACMLLGGLVLWAMDIIHGEICFSVLASFAIFVGIFGGQGFDPKFLAAHICGGGVVMGAFFMASDYATSPVSKLGQMVYGIIIGVLGGLFRLKSGASDSFSYSIIIANLFVPLIDMFIYPKPFAYSKKGIASRSGTVQEKKSAKDFFPKPVIVLTAIALIAGAALSGVYAMTKDTIEAQKFAANAASFQAVMPDAVSFEGSDAADKALADLDGATYGTGFGRVTINQVVAGKDDSGSIVGHAISVTSADGFDGNITLSVGIDSSGTVTGISFTELNETPGMGMRVDEPTFKDQFNGKSVAKFTMNKAGGSTADNEIDSVSGASTTSGAVVNAVNAALDFYQSVVKGAM